MLILHFTETYPIFFLTFSKKSKKSTSDSFSIFLICDIPSFRYFFEKVIILIYLRPDLGRKTALVSWKLF
jgi:hypothetical protein